MKKLRVRLRNWRKKYLDFSTNSYKIIWAFIFFVLIALTLSLDLIPNQVDLRAGQVSQSDITAPSTITFIDQARTSELRQRAADTAPRVYEEDSTVGEKIEKEINNLFDAVIKERRFILQNKVSVDNLESETANDQNSGQETEVSTSNLENESFSQEVLNNLKQEEKNEIIELIRSDITVEISDESLNTLIALNREELDSLKTRIDNLVKSELATRILPSDLASTKESLRQSAMEMDISRSKRVAAAEITAEVIAANMFLNQEATEQRRREAIADVEAVQKTVRQGEIIVRKGDVVTEADINILERLGLQKTGINYYNIAGRVLISLILVSLLGFYF